MNKIKKLIGCLMALCLSFGALSISNSQTVNAGVSNVGVCTPADVTGSSLSSSLWYFDKKDNSGTSIADGEIDFSPTEEDSRFNLKRKIYDLAYCNVTDNFILNVKLCFNKLPEGVKFVFAFGLPKVSAMPADESTALYFERVNGIVGFGVEKYGSDAGEKLAFSDVDGYSDGSYTDVLLHIKADGSGTLTVNGESFALTGMPTEGFAGFGQITSGSERVSVKLKDLSLMAFSNETPENTDYFEDFNWNAFCINTFNAKSRASGVPSSKLSFENGQMNFINTGAAFFETNYKYSNVDVSFDLTELQRENTFNEDGSVKVVRSAAFGVAFGIEVSGGMQTTAPLVVEFAPKRGVTTSTLLKIKSNGVLISETVLPEQYNMFALDEAFGLKISIKDGVLNVSIKKGEEKGYTLIRNENLGFTPLGYFQIASLGALDSTIQKGLAAEQLCVGSFSVDNLAIKNNDVGKMLKVIDFLSNTASLADDFEYRNEWSDSDLLTENIK